MARKTAREMLSYGKKKNYFVRFRGSIVKGIAFRPTPKTRGILVGGIIVGDRGHKPNSERAF